MSTRYLKRTPSGYYFRIRLPARVAVLLARRELVASLRTHSRRIAGLRAASLASRVLTYLLRLSMAVELDESAIRAKLDELLQAHWAEIEDGHLGRERPLDEEEHDAALYLVTEFRDTTTEQLAKSDLTGAQWAVDEVYTALGLPIDRQSIAYRRACRIWYEGWLRLYDRQKAMLLGEPIHPGPPAPEHGVTALSAPTATPKAGPKVSTLIPIYLGERKNDGEANEWTLRDKIGGTLKEFAELLGDPSANQVEREHIVKFRDTLLRLPKHRTIRPEYRDKSLAELLAMDIPEADRIGPNTVSQHIGRLSTFFDWCRAEKKRTHVTENPVVQIKLKVPKSGRDDLNDDDVRRLFNSEGYATGRLRKAYLWWLPLLGLYSGARLSELVLLRVTDVIEQDGVWLMNITDGKTENASRRIAIHSQLILLGFLEYVEAVRAAGHERVLFDVSIGKRTAGSHASKQLGKLLDRAGIDNADKVFHSTRHSANTGAALGQANLMLVQATIGHQKNRAGMTETYFHNDRIPPALLQETIEAIRYDVDLSHLRGGWRKYVEPPLDK